MGGNTVRVLQFLLESGHFAEAAAKLAPMSPPPDYDVHTTGRWKGVPASRPSACWVKSLTCISSPLNGTTFVSFLGVEHRTDTSCAGDLRIRWGSLAHVILILIRCAIYFPWFLRFFGIDLIWDHFEKRRRKEGFRGVLHTIATAKDITLRMHGSCVGDLTINAAVSANTQQHGVLPASAFFFVCFLAEMLSPQFNRRRNEIRGFPRTSAHITSAT